MALVTKNDVTQIFAIQAPEVDLPPTFANYPRGWDTARSNNGKPTIKQFNYIQQRTDQNVLWIHQNGAALPYDAAMEYAENAHVVKDGELQKKQGASWVFAANKGYNLDYFVGGKSYPLHAEIMLTNGDIVKSTIADNTVNPNVNMTGWVGANDASQIFYGPLSQANINYDLFNTPEKYGASTSAEDNTAALQDWLNSSKVLHIRPFKTYKFSSTLTATIENQSIIGLTHQKYGQSKLQYTGSGIALSLPTNLGYLSFRSWQLVGSIAENGDLYKAGTIGIDSPSGAVIEAYDFVMGNFERLYSGAGNSYYNKFLYCRFSDFKEGFWNIAAYNCEFTGVRWNRFTNAIRATAGSGPLDITKNCFERFNGYLVSSADSGILCNFQNNYVEIFDKEALPSPFVPTTAQTKGSFWGGNILFTGSFASLNIKCNTLYIGGGFRIGLFASCDALDSSGNIVSIYTTGNNLNRLYHNESPYNSFNVNDVRFATLGADGGYAQSYSRSNVSLRNVRNKYFYYDCIVDSIQPLLSRKLRIIPSNGWDSNAANEPDVSVIAQNDGSTMLVGALYGTIKTSNIALTIPESHRPVSLGETQASCVIRAVNIADGVNVLFKYTYSSGELELMTTTPPATLGNVLLNVVIPPRR